MQHALPRLEFENFVPGIFMSEDFSTISEGKQRATVVANGSPEACNLDKICFCETKDVKNDSVQNVLP